MPVDERVDHHTAISNQDTDGRLKTIMSEREPEAIDDLEADAQKWWGRFRRWATDIAIDHLPASVAWPIGAALVSAVGAAIVLPALVAIGCTISLAVAAISVYYSRRRMHSERRARAWSDVARLKLAADLRERENDLDRAVLLVAGDRSARSGRRVPRPPELRQALAMLSYKQREAENANKPRSKGAASRQPAPPRPVDVKAIERRMEVRSAEVDAIRAEMEALAVPGDPEIAESARESRKEFNAVRTAALRADREARELNRRGAQATNREGTIGFEIAFHPNGNREVSRTSRPTPEQLADPEFQQE